LVGNTDIPGKVILVPKNPEFFPSATLNCSEVLVLLDLGVDTMSPFFLLLTHVVKDLLWRNLFLPTPIFQADKLVVHRVRMLSHDVLFSGLGVSEGDHQIVLLALKTANPLLTLSLLWPCTKFQLVDSSPCGIVWC